MAGAGKQFTFHGAFNRKSEAERKERSRPGTFVRRVWIYGKARYLVAGPKGTVSLGGLVRV